MRSVSDGHRAADDADAGLANANLEELLRSMRTDRRRADPLWHQVETSLRDAIHSGALAPGTQLPREGRLASLLGVSRITVRHALANLESQGVVWREHGRGTYVRTPRLTAGQRGLTSLSQELSALGLSAEARLLAFDQVVANEHVAHALEITPGTRVWLVRRLRLAGGEEIGVQSAHLRIDRVPGLTAEKVDGTSLYEVVRREAGIEPIEATETYRVAAVGDIDAEPLKLTPGDAVFVIERTTNDRIGPFEFTESTMRGDRYEIRSTLRAP